jgi:hypothetical protein
MSHDKIGPKEAQLREMRAARFANAKAPKPPSASDLRKRISAVKPSAKKQGGRRGR